MSKLPDVSESFTKNGILTEMNIKGLYHSDSWKVTVRLVHKESGKTVKETNNSKVESKRSVLKRAQEKLAKMRSQDLEEER